MVTRGFSMEKKIVYFKLLQIMLTLAFIWRLRSLHQFCGTFADPKAFIHDNISIGHCKSFTLIGKDSKSGEFGAVFDHHKWHNQLSMMSSTNGQPIKEQQHHQFMDELAAKLPSAGRICIPIMISPFDFFSDDIGMDTNLLNNDILLLVSYQLSVALFSLFLLGLGIKTMLRSVEEYEFFIFWYVFPSVVWWCGSAVASTILLFYWTDFWTCFSTILLFYWTDFWTCFNFQADHTNVPFDTLVLSIVIACSSVFEFFFKNSLFKKRPVNAPVVFEPQHHKLRKHYATCAIE